MRAVELAEPWLELIRLGFFEFRPGKGYAGLERANLRFAVVCGSCDDNRVQPRVTAQTDGRFARDSAAKANQMAKALRFWVGFIRNTSLQEIL